MCALPMTTAHADDDGEAEAMYNDFRRSAYEEADIDTIALIRQMAAAGRFGEF